MNFVEGWHDEIDILKRLFLLQFGELITLKYLAYIYSYSPHAIHKRDYIKASLQNCTDTIMHTLNMCLSIPQITLIVNPNFIGEETEA